MHLECCCALGSLHDSTTVSGQHTCRRPVYDLHSALVAVTGSSRVRERRSLAQDLRGGSERRKVWLLQERQPLERGHEPDEVLAHIIGPCLGCVLVNLSAHASDRELNTGSPRKVSL